MPRESTMIGHLKVLGTAERRGLPSAAERLVWTGRSAWRNVPRPARSLSLTDRGSDLRKAS